MQYDDVTKTKAQKWTFFGEGREKFASIRTALSVSFHKAKTQRFRTEATLQLNGHQRSVKNA
jgi:hypothetical protein